jgi:transposase
MGAEVIEVVERRRRWSSDDKLAVLMDTLQPDPFSGHLFVFRGKRGNLVKILYWDGQGFCLFAKRLEKGRFVWPILPS